MENTITISIIEDVEDIRQALAGYLVQSPEIESVSTFESMELFFEAMASETVPPEVILSDIGLPGMDGIEGIKMIRKNYPNADVIMLTVFSDSDKIFNSLCAGATGYLLKGTPFIDVLKAIKLIHSGGSYMSPSIARKVINYFVPEKKFISDQLTSKEKDIIEGLTEGLSYKLIADKLEISIDTVRFHIKNIYRKLHVNSKAEVISKAFKGEL
ncbi:MAG TPA: response regulator transcription factor [Edaphocola sp.]|nr:response regulator transcription factor [Edaphocola sp.]